MFTDYPIIGQLFAFSFVVFSLWLVLRNTKGLVGENKIMFLLVFIVTLLCSVWFIDNIIAFKVQLLDEKENSAILQIMLSIVSFGLGNYVANKDKKD